MRLPTFSLLGSGPTILMLHDACGTAQSFAPQSEDFANLRWRSVAWNMPGYAASMPQEPYSVQTMARSCIQLIEALQHEQQRPVVLLGHGIGGMIALEVALRRADLVDKLILAATLPAVKGNAREAHLTLQDHSAQALNGGQTMPQLARRMLLSYTAPQADAAGVELAMRCMSDIHPRIYQLALQAQLAFDRSNALTQIQCPTLWITGRQDPLIPAAQAYAMAQTMHNARYVELSESGHFVNLEVPEQFTELVMDFIAPPVTKT